MSETSASLLERLRTSGNADAWCRLVDLYTPWIQSWLRRHPLQPSDEEDLVQEVLGVVVRRLPEFEYNRRRGAFRAWLRSITVNCLRNFWRVRQCEPSATGASDFLEMINQLEDPDSGLSRLWDREHDRHVAARLLQLVQRDFAPTTWEAFRRLVLEEGDTDVVAAELGISVNAALIAKSRVLRRLRQEARGVLNDM